ncbi:hypothetical protein [Amaricoccus solimangrovi]|uniref:Uncharacterized protein n=1 Tax=Amaricoccus solimangrovi TaxID=2589815 RepID=A0A501WP97_9RHOB|nr:hypothetical protein [Amaricoccus solimangrovi]TPE49954.1 hypothetical protein FJM51_13450 [Amaricoccus solimangrovi]
MSDPIQPEVSEDMNLLAAWIDYMLNGTLAVATEAPRLGFVLLVAEFGKIEDGRVNYISNGQREDMIALPREYLGSLEGRAQGFKRRARTS